MISLSVKRYWNIFSRKSRSIFGQKVLHTAWSTLPNEISRVVSAISTFRIVLYFYIIFENMLQNRLSTVGI